MLGSERTAYFHRNFVDTLGSLLLDRLRARAILDKELSSVLGPNRVKPPVTRETIAENLRRMRELAEAIQQDAVSLQVLIKTFKAQR